MEYSNVFHLMSDVSQKGGIPLIIIGGYAVNFYKVSRQTADLDFLLIEEQFDKLKELLEEAGYRLDIKEKIFARFKNVGNFMMDIDFLFIEKDTFNAIKKDCKTLNVAGNKFPVPSLTTLIALKLHAVKNNVTLREFIDLPDIIRLMRQNALDPRTKEFKELCLKYGTKEMYDKIAQSV